MRLEDKFKMGFGLVAKNFSPVRLKKVWEKQQMWKLPF